MEILTCDVTEKNAALGTGAAELGCCPRNFHSWGRLANKPHLPFCVNNMFFSSGSFDKKLLGFFPQNSGVGQAENVLES